MQVLLSHAPQGTRSLHPDSNPVTMTDCTRALRILGVALLAAFSLASEGARADARACPRLCGRAAVTLGRRIAPASGVRRRPGSYPLPKQPTTKVPRRPRALLGERSDPDLAAVHPSGDAYLTGDPAASHLTPRLRGSGSSVVGGLPLPAPRTSQSPRAPPGPDTKAQAPV
jgi:hypothetical protein